VYGSPGIGSGAGAQTCICASTWPPAPAQREKLMKIVVCDDHALLREAMRGVLKELVPDADVVEAADGRQAIRLIEANPQLDLLLLDLNLPDQDGLTLLADLRERHPEIAVVVLSGFQDRETVQRALRLGALGFIPKNTERDVVLNALRLVLAGGIYIPVQALDGAETGAAQTAGACAAGDLRDRLPPRLGLTDRQLEVLALVMEGKSNKAISRALSLAEHTVKNHMTAILKALQVTSRTEAVIAVGKLSRDMHAKS
jgi:DNA-binding NarL/FixJ family response regulator